MQSEISNIHARGSVLILALWTLAILAALAVASAAHLSAALRLARFVDNDVHASLAARAGVELALMTVVSETNTWEAIRATRAMDNVAVGERGRMRLVHYPDSSPPAARTARADAGAGLIPEEARISLNVYHRQRRALFEPLVNLLRIAPDIDGLPAVDIGPDEARDWIDLLLVRRDAMAEEREEARKNTGLTDSGLLSDNNDLEEKPSGFRSWHEVMHTAERMASEEGIDWYRLRAALQRIRPYTTLYGNRRVHLDSACETVLAAVAMAAGAAEYEAKVLAERIVDQRPREGFGEMREHLDLTAPQDLIMSAMEGYGKRRESSVFSGTAEGWMEMNGETQRRFTGAQRESAPLLTRRIDFVVCRESPGVLYWHEY